jgi:insulysin
MKLGNGSLYAALVNDALTEFSYDADLAGLTYGFSATPLGVFVSLGGYNDKMNVLAQHVLEKAKGLIVDSERLAVMKEQTKRDWENIFLGPTYKTSDYYGVYLLSEKQWTYQEKLAEISCERFIFILFLGFLFFNWY